MKMKNVIGTALVSPQTDVGIGDAVLKSISGRFKRVHESFFSESVSSYLLNKQT